MKKRRRGGRRRVGDGEKKGVWRGKVEGEGLKREESRRRRWGKTWGWVLITITSSFRLYFYLYIIIYTVILT